MNWEHTAKEELRSYTKLCAAQQNLRERIAALEERKVAIRTSTVTPVPTHGGGSQYEDKLLDTIVQLDGLRAELAATETAVALIERGLAVLNDEEQLVLDKFYMNRTARYVEELCDTLAVEQASVYRMAKRALYNYTVAAYGAGNMAV